MSRPSRDPAKWEKLIEAFNQKHEFFEKSDELSLRDAARARAVLHDPRNRRDARSKELTAEKIKLIMSARKRKIVPLYTVKYYNFAKAAYKSKLFRETMWTLSCAETEMVFWALTTVHSKRLGLCL